MASGHPRASLLVLSLLLVFSFPADASQMLRQSRSRSTQGQDKQHLQDQDPVVSDAGQAADSGDDDSDDAASSTNAPVYQVKPSDGNEKEEGDEDEEEESVHDSTLKHSSHAGTKKDVRLKLTANLRKQSQLKNTIDRLSNVSASDKEIDDSAELVANQTDSAGLAGMLSDMWKEQRMFELPAYSKYVDQELHHLKEDEKLLEAKVKAEHGETRTEQDLSVTGSAVAPSEEVKAEDGEDGTSNGQKQAQHQDRQTSTVNFWKMSRLRRESIFISSLVYLIFGVVAAVLFKQVRAKHFEPEQRLDAHQSTKDFSFSVFGCLGDVKICALGFCCPCLAWANTVERRLNLTYWKAFFVFFGLLLLNSYTMGISSILVVALGVYYRQKLRDIYGIDSYHNGAKGTVAIDTLLWCFCQPCAIIQEAREECAIRA